MKMTKITIVYAVILILIGLISYLASGMVSITALIPAFFGIVVLILGIAAFSEKMRKRAMHIASVLGLVGFLVTVSGLFDVSAMLSGEQIAHPGAAVGKSFMAIFSLVYFLICLWLFISVRLKRKKETPEQGKV